MKFSVVKVDGKPGFRQVEITEKDRGIYIQMPTGLVHVFSGAFGPELTVWPNGTRIDVSVPRGSDVRVNKVF